MTETELRQTIDAMGRTIERDARTIAKLKLELTEAKAYTQRLRSVLADAQGAIALLRFRPEAASDDGLDRLADQIKAALAGEIQ